MGSGGLGKDNHQQQSYFWIDTQQTGSKSGVHRIMYTDLFNQLLFRGSKFPFKSVYVLKKTKRFSIMVLHITSDGTLYSHNVFDEQEVKSLLRCQATMEPHNLQLFNNFPKTAATVS